MAIRIPEVKISCSGEPDCKASMPLIDFGNSGGGVDATKVAILSAIKVGYQHFDTAFLYGSEKPQGEAVAEALRNGLIHSPEELFITSKFWIVTYAIWGFSAWGVWISTQRESEFNARIVNSFLGTSPVQFGTFWLG